VSRKTTQRKKKGNLGRRLAFVLLTMLLFFGGAEAALRLLDVPSADSEARFTHNSVYWRVDPDLVSEPTLHKEVAGSFPVSTDVNGLRPPHHGVDKPDGVYRVMALGCSTTYGWGVADDETYPAVLERLLRERGHDKVEVINGGQPGYTSFQGLWLWDQALRDYEPDLVLVGYIVQDSRKAAYSDLSQAIMQGEGDFLKSNFLYSWKLYLAMKTLTGRVQIKAKERSEESQDSVFRVNEQEYLDNLRALRSKIESNGGEVVHFAYPLEVWANGYQKTHAMLLKHEAEAAGLRHFDPGPVVEEEARRRTLYFPQDRGHANADGNAFIGQLVADWLEQQGVLP
jgi:lysophospholipase L1-like esterase